MRQHLEILMRCSKEWGKDLKSAANKVQVYEDEREPLPLSWRAGGCIGEAGGAGAAVGGARMFQLLGGSSWPLSVAVQPA